MNTETVSAVPTDITDLVVDTAQLAALLLLENGAETFRAEETALILCRAAGCEAAEVIALPTGIFITVARPDGSKSTAVVRVKKHANNLFFVERVNTLSHDFAAGRIKLTALNAELRELSRQRLYRPIVLTFGAALSSAMFALLYEEALTPSILIDAGVAFFCALVAQLLFLIPRLKNAHPFIMTFLASFMLTIPAVMFTQLTGLGSLNFILIGGIFPLLPGLSLTNAIRDTVMGDLISGTVRLVETLLIALGIAGGVGVVLTLYVRVFGGVL